MTSTSTPAPTRRSPGRRGTALAAIATTVAVTAGGALLTAQPAQALGRFSGCRTQIAKVDPAGNPVAGASFQVKTADGSAKLLAPAQAASINAQFAQLVAPFQALVDASSSGVGVSSYGFRTLTGPNVTAAQRVAAVKVSIAQLSAFANGPTIPDSATAGFDTSGAITFQNAIRDQLAREQAYVNAGGTAPISTITPPAAADLLQGLPPSLNAADLRSRQIISQVNLPAPLQAQLDALKAAVEVPSLTAATQATGILGLSPAIVADPAGDPATISVDSGPAVEQGPTVGGVGVIVTETVAPTGFALDNRPQSLQVGFGACLPPAVAPAPGSPMWTITTAVDGVGRVQTATLRDVALAAVVIPPVVVPPVVVTPPAIPVPVVTPPVVPPVVVTPPVVVPPVIPVPVVPAPVVTPAPVAVPVTPAPVAVPVIPAPVVTPAPGVAIAVPVTPAPQVARTAPPRGVDAGMAPAAESSSGSGQRLLGALLALTGLAAAGGLIARRRRS